ncbi:TetR/AcrR family transcriptional regulator [Lichenifustis flavocetrariae]|uniref:TetR/AcrR family transcriptional regulator n=1 Tax=Lichenifustis flavocetrariae TaxID=2949735 RepID=A0AA41Z1L8_9HYPH|nr:TetR/AcrR family transcriptional regulator [Lichenifustis flavocetrariae]MCW6511175.1 TetR/AcrR family transcriptional regulator [Lichenifustis flavocetrariae]
MTNEERVGGKKLDIVKRAYDRFYDGGFHATGVDTVLADSGISKRTLYKHFPTKENLIEAVLHHYAAGVVQNLFAPVRAKGGDARAQIEAFFDLRAAMIDAQPARGCLGIKAAQEYAGRHAGIAAWGERAAREVESQFVRLCEEVGVAHPADLGRQINIVFQGTVVLAQALGDSSPFVQAKQAVATLLDAAGTSRQA